MARVCARAWICVCCRPVANTTNSSPPMRAEKLDRGTSATMLAAVAYDLFKSRHDLDFSAVWDIAIVFAVAFLAAVLVVRWVLSYVSRHGYAIFGWWRIIVGSVALVALDRWAERHHAQLDAAARRHDAAAARHA